MIKEDEKSLAKYIFLGAVALLFLLVYRIVSPYVIIIVNAFIFSFLLMPIYSRLSKKIPRGLSALICIILTFLIVILPIALILTNITSGVSVSINNVAELRTLIEKISSVEPISQLPIDAAVIAGKIWAFIFSLASTVLARLPSLLISFLIFVFSVYYLLVDNQRIKEKIKELLPFAHKEKILREINHSTHSILYGYFLVGLIDFVVVSLGLYITGVSYPFLFAFLTAILVFIPGLGPMMVMIPLGIFYLLEKNWFAFVGILIVWFIVAILIETILATKILGDKSRIHPLVMLIGIIGGTSVFGIFGFIIGPLVLVYSLKLLKLVFSSSEYKIE